MVMDVSATSHKLYNRPVSPSVEGQLRQEKDNRPNEVSQERTEHADKERAAETSSTDKRYSEEQVKNDQQHRHREVDAKNVNQQDAAKNSEKASAAAALMAEQVSASRQTRHSQNARRSDVSPALISHRGHGANQSYSSASEQRSGRMIDEMV